MLGFIDEGWDGNLVQGPVSQVFKPQHQKQHKLFLLKHCQNKNLIKTIAFLLHSYKHKHTQNSKKLRGD